MSKLKDAVTSNPSLSADSPRVLIVDDDSSTRLMAREVLGSAGFVVEEADGGQRGLRLVESFRPDVVLLDIVMPGMNGFETLRSLRELSHGSDCAVVMVTGLQDPGAVETAYELGASDFVTKPINWTLLRYRLNYVLRASLGRRALDEETIRGLEQKVRDLQVATRKMRDLIGDLLDPVVPEEDEDPTEST
jgi:DNA-binding response OmpR family regulator